MVDVSVLLRGCDAETLFVMKCTEEQYEFLQMVAEKSQEESTYSCMPDIHIDKAKPCKYLESGWCDKVPA